MHYINLCYHIMIKINKKCYLIKNVFIILNKYIPNKIWKNKWHESSQRLSYLLTIFRIFNSYM